MAKAVKDFFCPLLQLQIHGTLCMAISEIQQWVNDDDREYEAGRLLFERFGNNKYLKKLFAGGKDDYNSIRLLSELKEILRLTPHVMEHEAPKKEIPPSTPTPSAADNPLSSDDDYRVFAEKKVQDIDVKKLPEDLQILVGEKGSLIRQASSLHAKLELLPTDLDRMKAADKILNGYSRIDEIWRELDYFQTYGIRRPKDGIDLNALSTVKLIKRRNTTRTYLSKLKGKEKADAWLRYTDELETLNRIIKRREDDEE
jgi:hypothetical protein